MYRIHIQCCNFLHTKHQNDEQYPHKARQIHLQPNTKHAQQFHKSTERNIWHRGCKHGKVDQKMLQYFKTIIFLVKGLKVVEKKRKI